MRILLSERAQLLQKGGVGLGSIKIDECRLLTDRARPQQRQERRDANAAGQSQLRRCGSLGQEGAECAMHPRQDTRFHALDASGAIAQRLDADADFTVGTH